MRVHCGHLDWRKSKKSKLARDSENKIGPNRKNREPPKIEKVEKKSVSINFSFFLTDFSVSDPNKARLESFQSYFFGFTRPDMLDVTVTGYC